METLSLLIITKHIGKPSSLVKEKALPKLWILFQTLPYVLEKVLSIPILICETLMCINRRQSWYFITFKKFWHIYFRIIWSQSRDGWYCIAYWQIKYNVSRFMFALCRNQSYEATGSDALTESLFSSILEKMWGKKNIMV